jgi:PAS domain S-box-containing protein
MIHSLPVQRPEPAGTTRPARGSLARQTLIKMGVRLAVVVVALTAVSYYHVMSTITHQALDDLRDYIKIRGEHEQSIFALAHDNHQVIKAELVKRIHDYDGKDPEEEFDRRYVVSPDGVMRSRPELFDPARMAGVAIPDPAVLDADLRRRVLAAQDTLEQMGRAMHPRFQITWMAMPENLGVGYWPEDPPALFSAHPDSTYYTADVFRNAAPERNPERKSVWSRAYRDKMNQVAMVSLSTPVYDQDRFVGVIGHDITLAELFDRTVNVHLPGTYNLIVAKDGTLIAHPTLAGAIERADGKLTVADSGDPELQGIYEAASTLPGDSGVIEYARGGSYLGVVRIQGPEWYLVTVYPKALLEAAAYRTARFVLLGGLVSLLLEMLILYLVLREQVAAPLGLLLGATKKVASGDMDVDVGAGRDDELGELAASFNRMAHAVRDREAHMRRAEETLRQSEERFRLLFERSADALLLLDGERFIDCNEAAVALMRCAGPSDLISRRLPDLSPEQQPDGTPSAEKASELYQIAFDQGSHRFEWRARRANGEELPVEALITAIPFRDKSILYAVLRDITERKRAEEENRRLTEQLADNLRREIEKNALLERLWATVDALSTPVLEVWSDVLVLPVIGSVDDRRIAMMMEKLLAEVVRMQSRFVIIDVTGIAALDAPTADRLMKLARAVRLLGARCILTGIRPLLAKTLVEHEIRLDDLDTLGTLRSGLRECLHRLGVPRRGGA